MIDHLTLHTGVKNHACDICGKYFGMKRTLIRHKRETHSEIKPAYTCQCGKSYTLKGNLRRHESLGTCKISRKSSRVASDKSHIMDHLTVYTGVSSNTCDICGKRFGMNKTLIKHKKEIHSAKDPPLYYVIIQSAVLQNLMGLAHNSSQVSLADFTAASHKPPKWGALGGMNPQQMPSLAQELIEIGL
ncbi:zinc finger protein 776-like, partial [Nylanderia fulva]|uniref:zinc finger protein 776-like n=1 Tax=Nylanderia fulva TaxID=613905 RepID=UPI0010FB40B1